MKTEINLVRSYLAYMKTVHVGGIQNFKELKEIN